jgi:hypothetical protein
MATQVQGQALRTNAYGPTVVRAAAVLPATATGTLFSVVGGQVIITSFFGVVTTVMSGTATNLKINVSNTATAGNTDISANVLVTSKAVGTIFAIPTLGSAGTVDNFGVQNNEFLLGAGAIRAITDATNTGAMKWYVNYIPLDNGAYVVAA